jgi:hypothetical protein
MPTVTGTVGDWHAPIMEVLVGPGLARQSLYREMGLEIPGSIRARALIDTGSQRTFIDSSLIQGLQLESKGPCMVSSSTSVGRCDFYDARIGLYDRAGEVVWKDLLVGEVDSVSKGFSVLIGLDILSECEFHYDGRNGTFSLDF